MKPKKYQHEPYEVHYERQVASQLGIAQHLVCFECRSDATCPPVMLCSVSGQDGYDAAFAWDEAGAFSSKTAVVPRIGKFRTVHEAKALLIVLREKGAWPDPIEVLEKERARLREQVKAAPTG